MRNLKQVLQADYGLDLAAWTLTRANAMSADGSVIVGDGFIGGARRGWVAVIPIPEPTSCGGLCVALTMLSNRLRRFGKGKPSPVSSVLVEEKSGPRIDAPLG